MGWQFRNNRSVIAGLTAAAAWQAVTLTEDQAPAGTTGVMLQIRNTNAANYYTCFARPYGCSVNWTTYVGRTNQTCHKYVFAKVDASRRFDIWYSNASLEVAVIADTNDTGTNFADGETTTDRSGPGTGVYNNLDVSAYTPAGAKFAFFVGSSTARLFNLRHPDWSTWDEYHVLSGGLAGNIFFLPLNDSRIGQLKQENTDLVLYHFGALAAGWNAPATPLVVTPATEDVWADCNCSSLTGATGVIVRLINNHATNSQLVNVRKKGSTDDIITNVNIPALSHIDTMVGLDASGYFQIYNSSLDVEAQVIGYYVFPETVVDITDHFTLNIGLEEPTFEKITAARQASINMEMEM